MLCVDETGTITSLGYIMVLAFCKDMPHSVYALKVYTHYRKYIHTQKTFPFCVEVVSHDRPCMASSFGDCDDAGDVIICYMYVCVCVSLY